MHWGKNNHFSQDTWRLLSGHFGPVTPGQLGDFGHEFICISPILPPFPPKESSQEVLLFPFKVRRNESSVEVSVQNCKLFDVLAMKMKDLYSLP